MNDREILARLEAASPAELDRLLRRPSAEEARVHRLYFGEARYDALRRRTLATRGATRAAKRGNVVILHGIMGGELTLREQGSDKGIWLHVPRLVFGAVEKLRMDCGKSVYDIRATGILKKWYAEQILELGYDWEVQTYWYDWRRDLDALADDLHARIGGWFGGTEAVHLVAHSMGGLVARTYIARHPKRWGQRGKLIMLGTPNHGSFAIPQLITGALDTVRKLAVVDLRHNLTQLTEILGTLPGALQMLPSPLVMPAMTPLYQASTWGGRVPQTLLDRARRHHDELAGVVDGARMHYVAGCNRRTHDDIRDWKRLDALDGYGASLNGDGTVPHRLGFLEDQGTRIPTWFVAEDHGALPNNPQVIPATQMLLLQDRCDLPTTPEGVAAQRAARARGTEVRQPAASEEARLRTLVERLRFETRAATPAEAGALSRDEVETGEIVLRGFLGSSASAHSTVGSSEATARPRRKSVPPQIEIALRFGDIGRPPEASRSMPAVDALCVGHYVGVAPQNAELALDRAISGWKEGSPESRLVITSLHRRGTITALIGQQFLLPDPTRPGRLAVLAGMGTPGGFGVPELTVTVRELVWTLGRLRRRHAASVLIGAGAGNLSLEDAVKAWLRGLRRALYDAEAAGVDRIRRLTFLEKSPANLVCLDQILRRETARLATGPDRLRVTYDGPAGPTLAKARHAAERDAVRSARRSVREALAGDGGEKPQDREPIRFTVRLVKDTYEFSVLRSEASIPQRNTTVDPKLIEEINTQLVVAPTFPRQRDLGHLLGRMLLPDDLQREIIRPGVPTVLMVDATTARIHFELAAIRAASEQAGFEPDALLGTAANLTRQLRTPFAPLPEPPILTGRALCVLVVADPCEEARLPGAQEEGEMVARLFEECRDRGANIEVERLFGPGEATRVAVLDRLINQRFDLLHFAGHCVFNAEDPPRSGWLFSRQEVLSAHELSRIDRVPRFVFSNACESGVTPDRADLRHAGLAPGFAEAFFHRGVGNLICTAWPVEDGAARKFAERVYRGLLALGGQPTPECLHEVVKAARLEVAMDREVGGLSTWGAYQHYGDPYFRLPIEAARQTMTGAQAK